MSYVVLQKLYQVAIDYSGARAYSYLAKNKILYSESGIGVRWGGRGGEEEVSHERGFWF